MNDEYEVTLQFPQSLSSQLHRESQTHRRFVARFWPQASFSSGRPRILLALWISPSETASSVSPGPGDLWPPDQRSMKRRSICLSGTRRVLVIGRTVSFSFAGSTSKCIKICERKKASWIKETHLEHTVLNKINNMHVENRAFTSRWQTCRFDCRINTLESAR